MFLDFLFRWVCKYPSSLPPMCVVTLKEEDGVSRLNTPDNMRFRVRKVSLAINFTVEE